MSMSHHSSSPEEQAATRRMLDEFLGNAKPRFPQGKVSADDEGELSFAIAHDTDKQAVIIRFTKPVDWVGLGRDEALALANKLIEHAAALRR